MSINHRGLQIRMSQQFLYFSDMRTAELLLKSEDAAIDLVTKSLTSDHHPYTVKFPFLLGTAWVTGIVLAASYQRWMPKDSCV